MTAFISHYQQAASILLEAYDRKQLAHNGPSALTLLLGGNASWMDAIDPISGSIDRRMQQNHPETFFEALRTIESSGFSIEELIELEAGFEGRSLSATGQWFSTLDDDNDPDAGLGLSALLSRLEEMDARQLAPMA